LRVYLLRWRIEVFYRKVKQTHRFGQFHSQTMEINYGQTLLSLFSTHVHEIQDIVVGDYPQIAKR
jgi:hypothetical protein